MNKKYTIGGLIVLIVFIATYFIFAIFFFPDMQSRSQFGDLFGGVNALFSGLAFIGVVYTIFIQKQELSLQREELKLTREELKRTAEAQEKSEQALSKQAASLKVTAKLNGKSAVLQHYNALIGMTNSAKYGIDLVSFNTHKKAADDVIREINSLIEDK